MPRPPPSNLLDSGRRQWPTNRSEADPDCGNASGGGKETFSYRSSSPLTDSTASAEREQQVEDLRPNCNCLGAPRELPPVEVEYAVAEHKLHFGAPIRARRWRACRRGDRLHRGSGQAVDSTVVIVGHGSLRRALISRTRLASLSSWTKNQGKPKSNSRPLQGLLASLQAFSDQSINMVVIDIERRTNE
jgi:hypothetical protein